MAVTWINKWSWNTGYSADSVEWCPVESYHNVLVCGTYQLDEKDESGTTIKQKRLGTICLFIIIQDTTELRLHQTICTSGILDQKWCYHTIQEYPTLAVVSSDGYVQLYQLHNEDGMLHLKFWNKCQIGQDILVLSLDWSDNKSSTNQPNIVVSDSLGKVTILKVYEDGLQKIGVWQGHGFEAWITAFDYWNTNIFYSGGDDCTFKSYDMRVPDNAVFINKGHEAGVTAVRSHIDEEHLLLSGSYDEKVRLWDARNLKGSITEANVHGGVWRLKWHPNKANTILAACMYGGIRILKREETLSVVCEYFEHESIAYGADWNFDSKWPLVATCSFYDCKMQISAVI